VHHFVRKTQESNRKTIGVETARRLLMSLLGARWPRHVEPLVTWLAGVSEVRRGMRVTYDQWMSTLE